MHQNIILTDAGGMLLAENASAQGNNLGKHTHIGDLHLPLNPWERRDEQAHHEFTKILARSYPSFFANLSHMPSLPDAAASCKTQRLTGTYQDKGM